MHKKNCKWAVCFPLEGVARSAEGGFFLDSSFGLNQKNQKFKAVSICWLKIP
jgi:hypothetical protein